MKADTKIGISSGVVFFMYLFAEGITDYIAYIVGQL